MSDLSQRGLTALTWTFGGATILTTAGRYVIRYRTLNRLNIDDYAHGFAQLLLLGYLATYTDMFPLNYSVEFWVAGLAQTPSLSDLKRYFRLEIAVSIMFWVIIYVVKLTFLLLYRSIFGVSRTFMRAWWLVTVLTILTFLINFISIFWFCETPASLLVTERCLSPKALNTNAKIVSMWCGLNVLSNLSIMFLPLWMLHGLRMRTSKKIGLAGLFLLGFIDIAFDITRTLYTVDGGAVALDTIWDILEPAIAVFLSALPPYKTLLGSVKKMQQKSSYKVFGAKEGEVSVEMTRSSGQSSQNPVEGVLKAVPVSDFV